MNVSICDAVWQKTRKQFAGKTKTKVKRNTGKKTVCKLLKRQRLFYSRKLSVVGTIVL
jgi:hypothetical protein